MTIWHRIGAGICIGLGVAILFVACENNSDMQRLQKDAASNVDGGLNRVVNVMSNDGKVMKTFEGKIDFAPTSEVGETKVKFELNGKRVVIWNAVVISEEK